MDRQFYVDKAKLVSGFSARHGVDKLIYVEVFNDPSSAIAREKKLKKWRREWKIRIIEHDNPNWDDLSNKL